MFELFVVVGHVEEVRQVLRRHPEFLPEALAARPQSFYEALGRADDLPEPRTQRTAGEGGGHEEAEWKSVAGGCGRVGLDAPGQACSAGRPLEAVAWGG